jgi:predicted RNA methylase
MANQVITPEVEAVLRQSVIEDNALTLPNQLDRKLYEQVNKVIEFAGGKWNRSKKCHIFPGDPMTKLGVTLATGLAVDEKQKFQAFFTPPDLARRVVELAQVKGWRVLEPSAGHGALVEACARAGALSVKCIDINPEFCEKLTADGLTNVKCADFLTLPVPGDGLGQYDRIVMNPPFTRDSDMKHVAKAFQWLAPRGILVAIMLDNWKPIRRVRFLDDLRRESVGFPHIYKLGEGEFEESGTKVETCILKVVKP